MSDGDVALLGILVAIAHGVVAIILDDTVWFLGALGIGIASFIFIASSDAWVF